MWLSPVLVSGLCLLTTGVLGRPVSTFIERSLKRGAPTWISPADTFTASAASETSGNWAGVVVTPPTGENMTEVAGSFKVPSLANSEYTAACAWLGIDGWNGSTSLFQAGVDFWMMDGELTYNAWYEWVPDTSYNYTVSDIGEISAGDVLNLKLVATSETSGTILLENETTGKSHTMDLDAPPIANAVCCRSKVSFLFVRMFINPFL